MDQPIFEVPNIRYDRLNTVFALVVRAIRGNAFSGASVELAADALPLIFPALCAYTAPFMATQCRAKQTGVYPLPEFMPDNPFPLSRVNTFCLLFYLNSKASHKKPIL